MSLGNASLKLPYLLAHTPDWGVLEHSRIWAPQAIQCSWPYSRDSQSLWLENVLNTHGPHPHQDHLGPLTYSATNHGCHYGVPLMPMERCATQIILVVYVASCNTCWLHKCGCISSSNIGFWLHQFLVHLFMVILALAILVFSYITSCCISFCLHQFFVALAFEVEKYKVKIELVVEDRVNGQ